jgi:hypothetical protein
MLVCGVIDSSTGLSAGTWLRSFAAAHAHMSRLMFRCQVQMIRQTYDRQNTTDLHMGVRIA